MLAVRLHRPGEPVVVEHLPRPVPERGEVLIRVAACGVCHTDVHIANGDQARVTLPLTLGHEVAGWIEEWGPDARAGLRAASLRRGDPVLVFGGWGCGRCPECLRGDEQLCATGRSPGFQADGGYAEAMIVPDARHLVPLRHLDPVRAAPLADAGVTPYRAVRRAAPWLRPGARVLLMGLGGLGQFALQYLRRLPDLRIVVRELDAEKVGLATELGADLALLAGDADLARDGLGGQADVVLDMVGTDGTLALARQAVAPGGLVMIVGEAGGRLAVGFEEVPAEAWFTTTAWGSRADLDEVVALARRAALRWTIETVPLGEAATALARVAAGDVVGRLVLVPERTT